MPSPRPFLIDVIRLGVWLMILAVIFLPIERWFALRPGRRTAGETLADLGFYFLNSLLPAFLLAFPIALLIAAARELAPPGYFAWLDGFPLWSRLLATFVVGEIGFYWGHRWSHEWRWLWRFHAVHHRPARLDWLVNTRAHPIDMVFGRLCGLVPIYLTGLAGRGAGHGNLPALLFVIAGTVWGFLLHANVRWRLGWIERIVATPRFHHWHHARDGAIDRNYAAMLPGMDMLFGTLHLPRHHWPADYGVAAATASGT